MPYYIADGAVVKGSVSIGEDSGVWYNAMVRPQELEASRENCKLKDFAII